MKLIYIIGIILILTFPTTSTSHASPYYLNSVVQTGDYNFSLLQTGSFPANQSWIGFSVINGSSSSTVNIQNSTLYRGLRVSTYAYGTSSDTFLNMSLETGASFNLKITFSWNYNNSLFYTGNQVIVRENQTSLLNYDFGPDYGNNLYINGLNSSNIGPQPVNSSIYTLDISGNKSSNSIYTTIWSGWNSSMYVPYIVSSRTPYSGNGMSILVGGGFSNITLYNIFLDQKPAGFILPKKGNHISFKAQSLEPAQSLPGLLNGSSLPVVDMRDNSILYFSQAHNSTIYAYNYYSNATGVVAKIPASYTCVATFGNANRSYFLFSNSSESLLAVTDFNSFGTTFIHLNLSFSFPSYLITHDNYLYIVNSTGRVTVIGNTDTPNTMPGINGTVLAGGTDGNSLELTTYNETSREVASILYHPNGTDTLLGTYHLAPLNLAESPVRQHNSFPSATLEFDKTGTPEIAGFMGSSSEPYLMDSGYSSIPSDGGFMALSNGSSVTLASLNYSIDTNLNPNSAFVYVSPNGSNGLSIQNNSVTLYSINSTPYSGNTVSISFQNPGVLSGNVSLPYSIGSSVNYTLKASIGNKSLFPENGFLNFSTSGIPNGSYELIITASNIAGYCSTVMYNVSIDNYEPTVTVNPVNHSTVLENSPVEVRISGLPGPVNTYATFADSTPYNFTGQQFNMSFPYHTGNALLYLNITDQFGVTRHFQFFYSVEGVNTTGYHTNIPDNAYLSSGELNISWTPAQFVSFYSIALDSAHASYFRNTTLNYTGFNLPSGQYSLSISAILLNYSTVRLVGENFTVQSFNPNLTVKRSPGTYFSFFGDSRNDSLYLNASSNVSGTFFANFTIMGKTVLSDTGKGTSFSYLADSLDRPFLTNGNYLSTLTFRDQSGMETNYYFNFSVNNTIPDSPILNSTLYYNTTGINLPVRFSANETYAYYYGNGKPGGLLAPGEQSVTIPGIRETLTVVATTIWGNTNYSSVTLIHSDSSPQIQMTTGGTDYIWNNSLKVSYVVSDPVNLSFVHINVDNHTVSESQKKSGTVNVTLNEDGNFTLVVTATDLCGNANASDTNTVVCQYYPHISRITTSIRMFMGISQISSDIAGTYLQSVNLTWQVDGINVSRSSDFWSLLMPGQHTVKLFVAYHHTTQVVTHHVFTFGFVPEALAAISSVLLTLYRSYSGKDDPVKAETMIRNNLGKSRKEIYSIAGKSHVRRKTVGSTLDILVSDGEVSLMTDPDGIVYVMEPQGLH